jgi:GGDEF domain-containing protein
MPDPWEADLDPIPADGGAEPWLADLDAPPITPPGSRPSRAAEDAELEEYMRSQARPGTVPVGYAPRPDPIPQDSVNSSAAASLFGGLANTATDGLQDKFQRQNIITDVVQGIPGPAPIRRAVLGAGSAGVDVASFGQRLAGGALGDADQTQRMLGELERAQGEADKDSALPAWMNRGIGGIARSGVTALALGPAGVPAMIGGNALLRGNQAITEARDAGLEGADVAKYAATAGIIEGGITAIFQKMGLGGTESMVASQFLSKEVTRQGLAQASKALGKNILNELREETAITLADALNQKLSGVNPESLTPAQLSQALADTIVQTIGMGGAVAAPGGVQRATEAYSAAKQWVKDNPGEIKSLLLGEPTRSNFERHGITAKMNATQRAEFMEQVAQIQDVTPEGDGLVPAVPGAEANDDTAFAGPVDQVAPQNEAAEDIDLAAKVQSGDLPGMPRDTFGEGIPEAQLERQPEMRAERQLPAPEAPDEFAPPPKFDTRTILKKKRAERTYEELQHLTTYNKLTNLPGKEIFNEDVENEKPESVAFLDGNALKITNDNVSHDAGDEILRVMGETLTSTPGIKGYNFGQDEFGAKPLPGHEAKFAKNLEVARKRLRDTKLIFETPDGKIIALDGIRLGIGTGKDIQSADGELNNDKQRQADAGERETREQFAERKKLDPGALPIGFSRHASRREAQEHLRSKQGVDGAGRAGPVDSTVKPVGRGKTVDRPAAAVAEATSEGEVLKPSVIKTPKGKKLNKPEAKTDKPAKGKKLNKPAEPTPPATDKPSAADDIAREGDDSPQAESMGSMGGNLLSGRQPIREDAVPEVAKAPDPEVETRLAAAKGVKPESSKGKVKELITAAYNKITRANEFLPNDAKHAVDNETLRLLQDVPAAAQDEVNRKVAAIIDPMGKEQYKIFSRYAVMANLVRSVKKGEPLRFGFKSLSDAEAYLDTLQEAVDQVPEIKKAIENRKRIVNETVKELKDNGLLPEDTDSEDYYHQQVLERMQAASYEQRSSKLKKRGFQKGRVKGEDLTELGREFDYNTDYNEAETKWMTDARTLLMQKKLMDQLDKARGWHPKDDKDEMPDTHEVWAAAPGNVLHQALSIPEQVAEQVQRSVLDESDVSEDTKEAARMLTAQRMYVFPKELVQQLNALEKPKPNGAVAQLHQDALATWKWWQLNRPNNIVEYQVRNITGDVDAAINLGPGFAKYTVGAVDEVAEYYSAKKLSVSADMKAARDHGVIGASEAEADQPKIKDLPLFKRFYRDPARARMSFLDGANRFQAFREGVLRYAAFKYFRDQLKAGTLTNYGAAKKEVVDEIAKTMGVDAAAAHLSRNLIGDYGNITHFGKWMRRNMAPFWSYTEINLKRYPRLFINAFKAKGWTGAGKAAIPGAALLTTTKLLQMTVLYAIAQAWNKLKYPEEEEALNQNTKRSAHLILGKNPDGSIRVFRNIGSAGDFMENFGINSLISLWPKYKAGQLTAQDLLTEVAKDPVNKLAKSVRPDLKGAAEVASGYSFFPDVFNPRKVRRDENAMSALGLGEEYKAARGKVLEDGTRAKPNYWQNWLWSTENPEKSALGEMYDLKARYLTSEGRDVPDFKGLKSQFGRLKDAAENKDFKAFKESMKLYLEKADAKKFFERIDKLDPIEAGLNDADEKKFEQEFLTAPQRMKLKIVRDYAQQLKIDMYHMYKQAAEEEGGDVLKDFNAAKAEKTKNLIKTLRGKAPQKIAKEDLESGAGYPGTIERWKKGKMKAKSWMEAMR